MYLTHYSVHLCISLTIKMAWAELAASVLELNFHEMCVSHICDHKITKMILELFHLFKSTCLLNILHYVGIFFDFCFGLQFFYVCVQLGENVTEEKKEKMSAKEWMVHRMNEWMSGCASHFVRLAENWSSAGIAACVFGLCVCVCSKRCLMLG